MIPWTCDVLVRGAAARSVRRPISAGCYDPVADRSFVTWMGVNASPHIQSYDHAAGTWSPPRRLAESSCPDPAHYPMLVQAADGRLLVFHGAHNSPQRMVVSPEPHTADGTWRQVVLEQAPAASYPVPFRADAGEIYLFYRETFRNLDRRCPTDVRPVRYLVSADHGRTWRTSTELTGHPWAIGSACRADHMNEVYLGQLHHQPGRGQVPERVHLSWTLGGGGPDRHEHDRYHRDIHYAYFQPADRHFYSVSGRDLGTWIDLDTSADDCLVLRTEPRMAKPAPRDLGYEQLIGILDVERNHVVVVYRITTEERGNEVWASEWDGVRWHVARVRSHSTLLHAETVSGVLRLYLSDAGAGVQVCSRVRGRWVEEERLPTPERIGSAQPLSPYRDPVRLVGLSYSLTRDMSVTDRSVYVLGADGCASSGVSRI